MKFIPFLLIALPLLAEDAPKPDPRDAKVMYCERHGETELCKDDVSFLIHDDKRDAKIAELTRQLQELNIALGITQGQYGLCLAGPTLQQIQQQAKAQADAQARRPGAK